MKCDADAETKCKMISDILTAKPHYFVEQVPCDDNRLYIKVYADLEPQEKAEKLYQICEEEELIKVYKELGEYCDIKPCDDAQERYEDLCEYFGDAKDILKSRKDFKAWLERIKWHIHKAEELYEKYEHKQEPCENHEEKPHSLLDAYFQMRAEEISPCEDETKECIRNCFECKWSSFYKTEQEQEDVEDDTLYETGAIICDSCGSEIAFCPYCGAELESGE